MTRLRASILVLVLWAAIYLPGLGSTELKGEEARRIFPAVTMLETGDWLVPYVGGKPFLRKPPLMNWLIAASFKLTGVRNEWTARLPSALCVLALGLTIVGVGMMKPATSLAAALMSMTTFGLLAKARFAGGEIEGVYAPLVGIAIVLWLAGWTCGASRWRLWLVPALFLGLAALAKGPLHLLFFYGIVGAVLWVEKRTRELLHPAHFAAVVLMVAIFAAWAVPYFRTEAASEASEVWKDQMANRVTENRFDWKSYASNVPRGVGDLLPWVLLVPLLMRSGRDGAPRRPRDVGNIADVGDHQDSAARRPYQSVLLASAVMFLGLLLIPGILPRYVLPLSIPLVLVLAWRLEGTRFAAWPLRICVVLGVLSIAYATFAVPRINEHGRLRPFAAQIDAAVPAGETLIICDPEDDASKLGVAFYLRTAHRFAGRVSEIPPGARWVLAHAKKRRKMPDEWPEFVVTQTFFQGSGSEWMLYRRSD